jgi:hypothetical protein
MNFFLGIWSANFQLHGIGNCFNSERSDTYGCCLLEGMSMLFFGNYADRILYSSRESFFVAL